MDQQIFEKETAACRELSKKNGGKCKWGECDKCGVIPLLYKLGKGEFYDTAENIARIKKVSLD
jgi:hypothetical protein